MTPAKVAIDEASLAKSYSMTKPRTSCMALSAVEKDADAVRQEEAEWQGHRALAAEKPDGAMGLMRIPDSMCCRTDSEDNGNKSFV